MGIRATVGGPQRAVDSRGLKVRGARTAVCRLGGAMLLVLACALLSGAVLAGAAGARPSFLGVSFVDQDHGWITGIDNHTLSFSVWRTSNGGRTWTKSGSRPLVQGPQAFVTFVSPTTGVWGVPGAVTYTTDAGRTWTETSGTPPGAQDGMLDASFVDANLGWGGCTYGSDAEGGAIVSSTDGGATWTLSLEKKGDFSGYGGFSSVSCPTANDCYVLWNGAENSVPGGKDRSAVYATSDGGVHWSSGSLPAISRDWAVFNDICFPVAQTGWAAGDAGSIAMTTDGGATWVSQTSGVEVYLTGVDFVDASTGFAVGDKGCVLRTLDGGDHWVKLKTGTKKTLQALIFTDSLHGWVVGEDGVRLHTANGGKTWSGVR